MPHMSDTATPCVSVIIPTYNRPRIVRQAVQSVLAQTLREVEVIVVIDGPDAATSQELATVTDPRLRVVVLDHNSGPIQARTRGIEEARGAWIALLDDDDTWMPGKLAAQLAAARASGVVFPIVTCRAIASVGDAEYLWPDRPLGTEHISDYIIDRRSLLHRPGLIQASSIFAPKALFDIQPIPDHPSVHEDWGWMLLASHVPGASVIFVWEPLYRYTVHVGTRSRANCRLWHVSLNWAQQYRGFMTANAYSSFLLTKVARQARQNGGQLRALAQILTEAISHGQPRLRHLLAFAAIVLTPLQVQQRLISITYRTRTL